MRGAGFGVFLSRDEEVLCCKVTGFLGVGGVLDSEVDGAGWMFCEPCSREFGNELNGGLAWFYAIPTVLSIFVWLLFIHYGFKIHDSLSGSMHDHVLTFKADFDILGTKNSVQKVEFVPATVEYVTTYLSVIPSSLDVPNNF